jgi:16S rRNA (cytosine1402-N4)-methyltransferase
MRYDTGRGATAAGLLADASEDELVAILRGADEPHARRIARAIVDARRRRPVTTTRELAALVEGVRPRDLRRRAAIHPATLTFQALRMAVNDELAGLTAFVNDAASALAPGGRLAIVSFHAGEDRIVKNALADLAGRCTCPSEALRCTCGRVARVRILTRKPIRPGAAEIALNPRSRSARLRAAERLAAPAA